MRGATYLVKITTTFIHSESVSKTANCMAPEIMDLSVDGVLVTCYKWSSLVKCSIYNRNQAGQDMARNLE